MRRKPHAAHPHGERRKAAEAQAVAASGEVAPEGPPEAAEAPAAEPAAAPAISATEAAFAPDAGVEPPAEPADQALVLLERELAEHQDKLLRMAADFDNYRKRAAKDKAETWGRAQADLVQRALDVIDDLGRVAHLDPAQTSAQALHEGMGLVEKKFLKVLEGAGLERLDPSGAVFDPNAHEAVMTAPAPSAELDGKVSMVFQAGYRLGGALLRPARVAVYAWAEPVPSETVH
ncbi:MAG: nucleotide exchange factor GrpE [Gemmatimonadota bacterium]